VTGIGEVGKTLALTGNQRTLQRNTNIPEGGILQFKVGLLSRNGVSRNAIYTKFAKTFGIIC
jgi:hypothetical protein